jgi:hypothetical protein
MNTAEFAAVKTRRNTKFVHWYDLLHAECVKRGLATPTFGPAHDAYDMGESPETAAAEIEASQ